MYKWIMAVLFSAACIVGIAVLISQTTQSSKSENQAATSTSSVPKVTLDTQAAETLYKQNCASCHGDQLEGKIGPNLQKVGTRLSEEQLFKKVQNGGAAMPGYKGKLKDEEIANLSKWLEERKG